MPDCFLTSGDTMPIMPRKSASLPSMSLLSRYAQNTAISSSVGCSLRPHGTNILPYAHLIGVEALNIVVRIYDSIALVTLSVRIVHSSYTAGSLQQMPMVPLSDIVARYSRNHAPSWRQTSSVPCIKWLRGSAYAWTCAAFRLAIMNSGTSCPRSL